MNDYQKISNNFLVYSFVVFFILTIILGIFAVLNVVQEMSRSNPLTAISDNLIATSLGVICLFLIAPSYQFLHLKT